jgi:hypothetical protein
VAIIDNKEWSKSGLEIDFECIVSHLLTMWPDSISKVRKSEILISITRIKAFVGGVTYR